MKTTIFCLVMSLISIEAMAQNQFAPPSFLQRDGKRAVFIDLKRAKYEMTYDLNQQIATVKATLQFTTDQEGRPIFDLVDKPTQILIDGKVTTAELIHYPAMVRVVQETVPPGPHELVIQHERWVNHPRFNGEGVEDLFAMNDGDSRGLLEQFLPANLEYDQYEIEFFINIVGSTQEQVMMTNGAVTVVAQNQWSIRFPNYFNSLIPTF